MYRGIIINVISHRTQMGRSAPKRKRSHRHGGVLIS